MKKTKLKKKYTAVIVLAPDIIKRRKGEFSFRRGSVSFRYDIDNDPREFRLKAVRRLYKDGSAKKFILVGGMVEEKLENCEKKNIKEKVWKAEVMEQRLKRKYRVKTDFVLLKSVASTGGNTVKVLEYLSENNVPYLWNIGILTNFYHLSRVMRTFVDIFRETPRFRLIPVCAESIVYDEEYDNIRIFYTEYKFDKSECECERDDAILDKIIGRDKGDKSEIKGLGDMEREVYGN